MTIKVIFIKSIICFILGVTSISQAAYYDTAISRADFLMAVMQKAGYDYDYVPAGSVPFSDVPSTHSHYFYIQTAKNEGFVTGYGDNTFRPETSVSRGEAARIVTNVFENDRVPCTVAPFADVPISQTFCDDIQLLSSLNILQGLEFNGDYYFYPDKAIDLLTAQMLIISAFNYGVTGSSSVYETYTGRTGFELRSPLQATPEIIRAGKLPEPATLTDGTINPVEMPDIHETSGSNKSFFN